MSQHRVMLLGALAPPNNRLALIRRGAIHVHDPAMVGERLISTALWRLLDAPAEDLDDAATNGKKMDRPSASTQTYVRIHARERAG